MNKVTTLNEFLEVIEKAQKEYKKNIFYRGHSCKSYNLESGIYRNKKLQENENELINEILSKCPEDFKDCKSNFDYLVKMQHYGSPTRLLDITTNPLVALYFACQETKQEEKDGEVVIIQAEGKDIKYTGSDTVDVLCALSRVDQADKKNLMIAYDIFCQSSKNDNTNINLVKSFSSKMIDLMDFFSNDIKTNCSKEYIYNYLYLINIFQDVIYRISCENKKFIERKNTILYMDVGQKISKNIRIDGTDIIMARFQELFKSLSVTYKDIIKSNMPNLANIEDAIKINDDLKVKINVFINEWEDALSVIDIEKLLFQVFSNHKLIGQNLLHQIKIFKPAFKDRINPYDLNRSLIVHPKMDNQRIIRQQGLFILQGLFENSMKNLKKEKSEIIIPQQYKKNILEELETYGISKEVLFPEIKEVSQVFQEKLKEKN